MRVFKRKHVGVFGHDRFGALAEQFARIFGTPQFIGAQTVVVVLWVAVNAVQLLASPFDPYPFILLNLGFSLQAAYAAPLILLAQTRQAERDKTQADDAEAHREELAQDVATQLADIRRLIEETHGIQQKGIQPGSSERQVTQQSLSDSDA